MTTLAIAITLALAVAIIALFQFSHLCADVRAIRRMKEQEQREFEQYVQQQTKGDRR